MELCDVVYLEEPVYAHICEGKDAETLQQHTELCRKYFHKLIDAKGLESILNRFVRSFMGNRDSETEAFFWELLEGVVTFHDTGKINPAFQRERMRMPYKSQKDFWFLKGGRHSLLSSAIYIDYCFYLLSQKEMSRTERKKWKKLIYVNSYVISRHHGDLENMGEYGGEFIAGGSIYDILRGFPDENQHLYKGPFYLVEEKVETVCNTFKCRKECGIEDRKAGMNVYIYARLVYSLLTSVDYYATTEYMNGFEIHQFGAVTQMEELIKVYENCGMMKSIRAYEKAVLGGDDVQENEMNSLRSQLFLEAEAEWMEKQEENLFFLEAPTGSGKSNTAMNLSFQMLKQGQSKLYYVYPFNTLVDQNLVSIQKIFGENVDIMSMVSVVNSVTPIKMDEKMREGMDEVDLEFYQKALLDRQFLNYPFILTTHVSLFETLFGNRREALFGFLQMAGSVIVLDEIQSYKNILWSEIILFLKAFAEFMNMKVLIMSATLPDLEYLTGEKEQVVRLMKNRDRYFLNPVFRERVGVSYEMLEEKTDYEMLYRHIDTHVERGKKVLIEFIKKTSAYDFYEYVCQQDNLGMEIRLLTGDNNRRERGIVLNEITSMNMGVILIATQIVEAGVDIDMDIGYKDISKLDSEEQFLGRINRSCKRSGIVYFFDMDKAEGIYKNDFRMNREFTLQNDEMRRVLSEKSFADYYLPVLKLIKESWNESTDENGLERFFNDVETGDFPAIASHMQLIKDDQWTMSVYLSRIIEMQDGVCLDGWECWERYKELLFDQEIPYAKKQVLLSEIRSNMSYFIYEIKKNSNLVYSDRIGELYAIQDGEKYFVDGKLDKKALEDSGGMFIE